MVLRHPVLWKACQEAVEACMFGQKAWREIWPCKGPQFSKIAPSFPYKPLCLLVISSLRRCWQPGNVIKLSKITLYLAGSWWMGCWPVAFWHEPSSGQMQWKCRWQLVWSRIWQPNLPAIQQYLTPAYWAPTCPVNPAGELLVSGNPLQTVWKQCNFPAGLTTSAESSHSLISTGT